MFIQFNIGFLKAVCKSRTAFTAKRDEDFTWPGLIIALMGIPIFYIAKKKITVSAG